MQDVQQGTAPTALPLTSPAGSQVLVSVRQRLDPAKR